ncbi:fungal-specific transcription factor domain-containing protein [Umbelopsis sp. PMI_123]|nr:fungal-specific transcription factor domain-containing protein [Umbelopsis sp. PMI_123]
MSSDGENEVSQGPACVQCRKRKHKCSRGEPCQSCMASGAMCYYAEFKKRGAKPGYIETLTKRMDQLESIVLGQSLLLASQGLMPQSDGPLSQKLDHLRHGLMLNADRDGSTSHCSSPQNDRKRKRSFSNESETDNILPPEDLLKDLCRLYFEQLHPWIPILHQDTFEEKCKSPNRSILVLQAITAATIKFTNLDQMEQEYYYKRCRQAVLLASMDRFSVETLQASIIIAYDTIGSGRGPRSWSIVSSATRIVEQLGLAGEDDDMDNNKLLNRVGFLVPAKTVTETEERRRIFWSIFQMDRFCSVTTGWNTSLTSSDVKRRLPTEGSLFKYMIYKKTRYFNISDPDVDSTDVNDALGGYAYVIEATECLNRVATFLLHEKIDFTTREGMRTWFDGFQALDSMLVRWKTFLPEKWQVASVQSDGRMDENLTLAHITHNTSVLLLHHHIAYPPADLNVRLPSLNSAQTCFSAALEIATIASKFLLHMRNSVSPQFAFCLFVAARTVLAHSTHCNADLDGSFGVLVDSLREISSRWNANGPKQDNLANKLATKLENAKNMNSPINARKVVFEEDEGIGSVFTLASPSFVEGFRSATYPSVVPTNGHDIADNGMEPSPGISTNSATTEVELPSNLTDFDHIFMWADYPRNVRDPLQ